ncbi:MAG TPA: agmatine deiminase family protein [Thermoguttaceae bacterium]|nr:agmatine deiminase family protein [Thermoguttaceae bacterium]
MLRNVLIPAFLAVVVALLVTRLVLRARGGELVHPRPMSERPVSSSPVAPTTHQANTTEIPAVHLPGEFEPQEAIVLAAGRLAESWPNMLADMVAAIDEKVTVLGFVNGAEQRARVRDVLLSGGVSPDRIRLAEAPLQSRWMRDYGPIVVHLADDTPAVIDAIFVHTVAQRFEDDFSGLFASQLGLPVSKAHLVFEGGNLLSNGRGICLTTWRALLHNQTKFGCDHDYEAPEIHNIFTAAFGSTQTAFLEPLHGNRSGHVDMFAVFTSADTVVVGSYNPALDPVNAAVLDRNARTLACLKTEQGPLHVVRIPMPPNDDGIFRTYTNVLFANNTLLVPIYPGLDPEGEQQAMATYRRLLPGRKVVGIDVTEAIAYGGGLHCVTSNIPASKAKPLSRPTSNLHLLSLHP